ncbi:MAG: MATE family efflux transporter [Paraprevotella sp.]|nr:MATE family efflux transporter [Paraprevotella sp.]
MTREMTEGSPMRLIFNFAFPLILGSLLQQTYSLIDAAIVGKYLGINNLAAVGASTSVVFLIIGFCIGCCCGFGIPVAQRFGARDYSEVRRYVANSIWVSLIISVFLALITSLLCGKILLMMQTPDEILHNAYLYILVTFIGIPFTFLYNLLSSIIRALGDSKTPFYFLLLAAVLNIILDLFCIIILHWGVAGAAIATIFSQAVSASLCLYYMFKKFHILKMQKGEAALDKRCIKGLLNNGVPMGLQFSITAIGSIMLQSANNALGTTCVAAFTAGMRIKMVFMCPLESMGIAMATYCGQNYGAGKTERINMGLRSSFFMVCIYCVFCFIFLHLWAENIIRLFVDADQIEVIKKADQLINTSCTYFIPLGLLCLLRYSIQGLGYSKLAMLSGVCEMMDRTAVSLFLVPALGYTGVCYGDPSAWFAADLFLIPAYLYVHSRLNKERCCATASR